jgi:hypothetical protein
MSRFNIGDVVTAIKPVDGADYRGLVGKVVEIYSNGIGVKVEFDASLIGDRAHHDGDGTARPFWNFWIEELRLVDPCERVESIQDLAYDFLNS